MFDSSLLGPAEGPDYDDIVGWTAEDDAMVAALTEAACAEADLSPAEAGSFGCEDPIEVLVALLSGPRTPVVAGPVEAMRAHARMVAHYQALLLGSMMWVFDEYSTLTDDDPALAMEGAVSEIRAALSLTRRAAGSDLDLAWSLRERLPEVLEALKQGRIDLRRAWVIVQGTAHLRESQAQRVADRVLPFAEGRTTGQLRALIRRLCLEDDPHEAARRHEVAIADRGVVAEVGENSTATITGSDLPPERVAAIMDRLTRIAQSPRRAGEERTIDQLRADVFLDLLEGNKVGHQRGTVNITVDLATLIGLEDRAADLGGFGPVVADIARQMTERFGPSWRVGVTDEGGEIVHSGNTRRRPNAALRRLVESRDPTCVFPGCRRPAGSCDLDHRVRVAEGGTTHRDQLVPLCRHDHVIRHRYQWIHVRNSDGSHTWTSPLGVEYTRPPPA